VEQAIKTRIGGHVVVESLEALGAEVAFGLPGVHALAMWDGLRTSGVRFAGFRTELCAGFAADGYARASGRPAPLLLSTGPGALISLASLMEAASSHVPVVAIASQIPRELIGRGRGYLHELPDQLASFAPVVKWDSRAESAAEIPELLAEAWRRAQTPPSGPVFLEIPVDILTGETDVSPVKDLDGVLAALHEEGVKVDRKVEESEYGRFSWITDPEGNRIELWEPPKEYSAPKQAMPME